MASKTSPFTDHWKSRHVDSNEEETFIRFSEALLTTLYHKTNVGSIPRGIDLPILPYPEFFTSPNWKKEIEGCYWCCSETRNIQAVCCSKKCLYFLHEWCIDRVKHFTKEQTCKYPGCYKQCQDNFICCSAEHRKLYNGIFKEFHKIKRDKVFSPSWYVTNLKSPPHKPDQGLSNRTSQTKPPPLPKIDLPIGFKSLLIYETDVGPIPRSYKQEQHLESAFSSSPNWNVDITGCYQCSGPINNNREFLCSKECNILFYEWCRRKVSHSNRVYCKYTACGEIVPQGELFCGKDHERGSKKAPFKYLLDAQVDQGPKWYVFSHSDVPTGPIIIPTNPPQEEFKKFKNKFLFSPLLTKFLYKDCDVGPIPRKLLEQLPDVNSFSGLVDSNWNAIIPGCYWCCADDHSIHDISCSNRCFYLFNEWCHEKLRKSKSKRLCKFLFCNATANYSKDCCKREHTEKYNNTFVSKCSQDLKSTNYALGPKWYFDKSSDHIDFHNREDPFYEFTNFFVCSNLIIDDQCWDTTEHYFQAQKFVGTPHCEYIRRLTAPRDAYEYIRNPDVQCWIRTDWNIVKEYVMLKALQAKFNQDEFLKDLLIRTGDKQLFEHTRNDSFWGDGGDRKGQNKLGCLLMQVRFDLHAKIQFLPLSLNHYSVENVKDIQQPSNENVSHTDVASENTDIDVTPSDQYEEILFGASQSTQTCPASGDN